MKTFTSFFVFLFLGAALYGEAVLKNSVLTFGQPGVKLVPYTQTVKWISPEERAAKNTALAEGKDKTWKFKTVLPGKSAPVEIETKLVGKAENTFEYSISWQSQDGKDIKEKFLFLNFPLKSIAGKKFVFNGKEVPVVGVKKFAWYQLRNRVISMTFFKGEAGEFTLTSKGRIRISCETHPAANRVWVRIYPVDPKMQIELTVTTK